jgi:hypothetical protein
MSKKRAISSIFCSGEMFFTDDFEHRTLHVSIALNYATVKYLGLRSFHKLLIIFNILS